MLPENPRQELLAAVAAELKVWGNRWYVFGAQAVMIWGRPRMSADVDITARLVPEDPIGFARSMQDAGFDVRVDDLQDFVTRTRVIPFLHRASQMPLDVVLAGPGLEDQFLDRAVPVLEQALSRSDLLSTFEKL